MGEKTHEDHIRNPGYSSLSHHNLVHDPIPIPAAMIILQPQAAVDRNGKIKEVRAKQEVVGEARKEGRIMRFATSTDLCHHQKSEIDDVPQITQDMQCEKKMW